MDELMSSPGLTGSGIGVRSPHIVEILGSGLDAVLLERSTTRVMLALRELPAGFRDALLDGEGL